MVLYIVLMLKLTCIQIQLWKPWLKIWFENMRLKNVTVCSPFWYIYLKLQLNGMLRWFQIHNLLSFHRLFHDSKLFWTGQVNKANPLSPGIYTSSLTQTKEVWWKEYTSLQYKRRKIQRFISKREKKWYQQWEREYHTNQI